MVEQSGMQTLIRLRELERKLRVSDEVLFEHPEIAKAAFDAALDGIVIADENGHIRLINKVAEEMFGYDHHEIVGKMVSTLIPLEYKSRHDARQATYFEEPIKRVFREGLEGLTKDGRKIPVMIALNPIRTELGTLVIATIREISH